jgi:TolB protein
MRRFSLFLLLAVLAGAQQPAPVGIFESQGDIGASARPGSAEFDLETAVYRITGGGANMWGTSDAFHFVWKKLSGDFALQASVMLEATDAGANSHRKAGLVIRQSLDPGAPYVDVMVHGSGLTALQFRKLAGGETEDVASLVSSPVVIRLERRGDVFEMWVAPSGGEPLRMVGSVTLPLPDPVYAGLAVCSHDAARMERAEFAGVRIDPPAASAPATR